LVVCVRVGWCVVWVGGGVGAVGGEGGGGGGGGGGGIALQNNGLLHSSSAVD